MMLTTVLLPAGLIVYGWSAQVSEDTMQVMPDTEPVNLDLAQYHVFWIVPDLGAVIFTAGV